MAPGLPAGYAGGGRGIGEDSFLLVCGGLYDAALGIADAQRTGSDVLSMWTSEGGGGKAVPFTVKQNLLRSYMASWWYNDADCLMLRRQEQMTRGLRLTLGLLSDTEVRTVLANQYLSGGLLSQTEPLADMDQDRTEELRHLLPYVPVSAVPVLDKGERIPSRVHVRGQGLRELVLLNWSDTQTESVQVSARDILGDETEEKTYILSAFYSGQYGAAGPDEAVNLGSLPPHSAEIVRVQPRMEEPQIVGSTGHFALGAEVEDVCTENGRIVLKTPHLPFPVTYSVLWEGRVHTVHM